MRALLLAALLPGAAAAADVAGSVVSSKEWRVRRAPHREEEFIGDVRYQAGANDFAADWALFRHETKRWQARGRVVMKRRSEDGDVLTAKGDEAAFDQASDSGWVSAKTRVGFERKPADGTPSDFGEGGRFEWKGRQKASLLEGTHVWGPRLEGWAHRADYDGLLVTLSGGRPVLFKGEGLGADWVGAVKADAVTAERQAKTLSASGRVVGWLEFRDLPEKPR